LSAVTAVAHSLTSPIPNANHMQQLVRCNVQTYVSATPWLSSSPITRCIPTYISTEPEI